MSKPIHRTSDLYDIQDCSNFKKYKVYCIKNWLGKIIYIGCTKDKLSVRCSSHSIDNTKLRPEGKIGSYHLNNGKKLKIEVMYDFNNKFFAGISERILIHFYKNHVDSSLINKKCNISEDYFTSPFTSVKHY